MILVYKTSVKTIEDVKVLEKDLSGLLPNSRWNFDLEDCDNIFRVENSEIASVAIVDFFLIKGFECIELLD